MTVLADFVRYVELRQLASDNRARGLPQPWSADPIIAANKFCAVVRDDDRTSRLARQIILGLPQHLRLGAALTFRCYNRIETLIALRDADALDARETEPICAVFDQIGTVIGTAYKINVGGGLNNKSKIAYTVLRGLRAARNGDFVPRRSAQITTQAITGVIGPSPFIGYQIMQDVRWLTGSYDDEMRWCHVGIGAARGIRRLRGTYLPNSFRDGDKAKRPLKHHPDLRIDIEFAGHLQAAFAALMECGVSSRDRLTMFDVEHNFCEFDKFERVRTGEAGGVRFRPRLEAA